MFTARSTRILFAFLGVLLASLPALAGSVQGTVVGRSGQPKPYVRVDLAGPETRTLFTDANGTFSAELPGGDYVARVTERNRWRQFDFRVPDQGRTTPRLELGW